MGKVLSGFVVSLSLHLLTAVAYAATPTATATLEGLSLTLIEHRQPKAEIVVARDRPRMVTLGALELQLFLQKMSGVRVPIVTTPTAERRVRIHVGRSAETDRLGVSADGLRDGAYRIVSGPDWIVLIGRDVDFDSSRMPWPLKRNDAPRAAAEWAKAIEGKTDSAWEFPFASGFKGLWNPKEFGMGMRERYGEDFRALWQQQKGTLDGFWNQDESGSLNAVYGLLRHLGVRWFMPGDLGEVVPKLDTIAVGPMSQTVKPDFPLRKWMWYNYASFGFDEIIWARRLGMNSGIEQVGPNPGPHGLSFVHGHATMKKAHPEYYALIGGKRDTEHRDSGTPCFTSAGLVQETARYIRFLYDTYGLTSVDIWPVDGLRLCQCETCKGKSASELVWGFADRVAAEVLKTHPDRRITCGAYTSYINPPASIEKFSPNLAVWIANAGRPLMEDPEHWAEYRARVRSWQSKVAPGNILRLENNRYHIWGGDAPIAYPVIHPRGVARDLKAMKGISLGDTGEQSQEGGKWRAPGLEHLTLYVQSRFLWDADQDIDEVLREYFDLFYGPAAQPMSKALAFAEENLAYKDQSRNGGRSSPGNVSLAVSLRLRTLLDEAKVAAGDSVYGKRVQTLISELQPREALIAQYREKEADLAKARTKAPVAIGIEGGDLGNAAVHELKDNAAGTVAAATPRTTFRVGWDRDALLFDIVCKEPEIRKLNIAGDVRSGDRIVLLLETPLHSYYHLEINPDGVIVDGNPGPQWKSLADVRSERGNDFWRVQVRVPVVGQAEADSDPRHRVAGAKPSTDAPWYFNVGRVRVLDLKQPETQAFSPSKAGWHVPAKFARLTIK